MKNIMSVTFGRGLYVAVLSTAIVLSTGTAAVAQEHGQMGQQPGSSQGMGGMQGMGMTQQGMQMDMGEMGGGMSGPQMMGDMKMPDMAKKKGMEGMQMKSTLPGFPGSSHLYHVGSTGFFLDHPKEITLTAEQQTALSKIKEKTIMEQSNFDRKIEQAEQELWQLTAADSPDAVKIEAKIREIEKLRGDERIAFIRGVGEAAKVLNNDQRAALLGTKPAAGHGSH